MEKKSGSLFLFKKKIVNKIFFEPLAVFRIVCSDVPPSITEAAFLCPLCNRCANKTKSGTTAKKKKFLWMPYFIAWQVFWSNKWTHIFFY